MKLTISVTVNEVDGDRRVSWWVKQIGYADYARVPVIGDKISLPESEQSDYFHSDGNLVTAVKLDWDGWVHIEIEEITTEYLGDDAYERLCSYVEEVGFEKDSEMNRRELLESAK